MIEAGYDMETIDRQVKKVLSMVNLEGTENLYPAELSGGMMKRVGIARALVGDPKYLLYDEPTAGLDPVIADRINDQILYLKEYLKKTAVVVTHDLRSALKVSDRIALMADGVIVTFIRKEEIFQVEHPEMRQFLKASGLS
ncbi:MAG: ATP-binding cassette domain-containing protein [Candidatus Hydrothermae bacterium]|nr:ATP-binding cassette domain-containing protein [Candidatus Hydrothermae bacterium]